MNPFHTSLKVYINLLLLLKCVSDHNIMCFRTMPGPPVAVCKGDTVVVDVINELETETTSIHFHG